MIEDNLLRAASSPETELSHLHELSQHPSERIRAAVASNPSTDEEALLSLVGDSSKQVIDNLMKVKSNFHLDSYEFSAAKSSKLSIVNLDDAEFILSLRVNPALNKYISQVDTDVEEQRKWLIGYKKREARRAEFYFIIKDQNNDKLGTVRLYDFQNGSFCWGSWVIKPDSPSKTAIESALNVYEFAFNVLRFSQSHFEVRNENTKVIKFHKRMGAKEINSDDLETFFILEKKQYEITRVRYEQFLL